MINDTIKQLQQHKRNVLGQIADLTKAVGKLDEAIALVAGVSGSGGGEIPIPAVTVPPAAGRKKRGMTPAGKARLVAAQKARWARYHAAQGKAPVAAEPGRRKKSKFSAAGLARIKAAQRARWAKYNANKAKAGKK